MIDGPPDRLLQVFGEALIRQPGQARESFIAHTTRDEPGLEHELRSLLHANDAAGDFLIETTPLLEGSTMEGITGLQIGRYTLLEKIGEGGAGSVFAAEQQEPVRRRVALKLIKAGMDTASVIARFEGERQALAMMDHPNIAKVFDAGSTATGRPYFVMELVDGTKITDYCTERQLSIDGRLDLFLQVCEAVQHAHQKGIIHRDLKPSNILVTQSNGAPAAQVIDFGIAKAIEGKLTAETIHTLQHQFLGTPAYMSPEQVDLSRDIDTRTDIYSLGVLLYEILTGKPPFDNHELLTAGLDAMRRIIRESEPPRPSASVARDNKSSAAKFAFRDPHSAIPSDLDWIVMKCLDKDRARRYDTASSLAADIRHYLNHEPILARAPGSAYRFRKFVQRHRIGVAAGLAVALTLITGICAISWQTIRAQRAELNARQEALKARSLADEASKQASIARQVKRFLFDNLLGVNAGETAQDQNAEEYRATRLLLDKAARKLEGKFTNDPASEAELRMQLAHGFTAVRDFHQMKTQARRALTLFDALFGPGHTNTLDATSALAWAQFQVGEREAAFALLTNALPLARPAPGTFVPGGASLLAQYAYLLAITGGAQKAIPLFQEAVDHLKTEFGPDDYRTQVEISGLARAFELTGDFQRAEPVWRQLAERQQQDLGRTNQVTVGTLFALARNFVEQNKIEEATPMLEEIVTLNQQQIGSNQWFTLDSQYWLGRAYEGGGKTNLAADLFQRILPSMLPFFPVEGSLFCSIGIAEYYVRQKSYDSATAAFRLIRERLPARAPEGSIMFQRYLRVIAGAEGWHAAADFCRRNIDFAPESASDWLQKAWVFRSVGDEADYAAVVRKGLALSRQISDRDQHILVEIAALGPVDFSIAERDAITNQINGVEQRLSKRSANTRFRGSRALAQMQFRLEKFSDALSTLARVESQVEKDPYALFIKASCLHRLGQSKEARAIFEKGTALTDQGLSQLQPEAFLAIKEVYENRVMRRETEALLAGPKEGASR
jgi:eukaryotic-like serine/threonine-protein kinase